MNSAVAAIRRRLRTLFSRRARSPRLRLHCSLQRPDYIRIRRHAERVGEPPTSFLRHAALAYIERRYLVPRNLEERLRDLTLSLRTIGGHLNQLAAKANTVKRVTVFDLARARRLVRRLEEDIKTFVRRPPHASPPNPDPA